MTELSMHIQCMLQLVRDASLFPSSIPGGRHTGIGKLGVR